MNNIEYQNAGDVVCIHEPLRRSHTAPDDWFFHGKKYPFVHCKHTMTGREYFRVYRSKQFYEVFVLGQFEACFMIVDTPETIADPFGLAESGVKNVV